MVAPSSPRRLPTTFERGGRTTIWECDPPPTFSSHGVTDIADALSPHFIASDDNGDDDDDDDVLSERPELLDA